MPTKLIAKALLAACACWLPAARAQTPPGAGQHQDPLPAEPQVGERDAWRAELTTWAWLVAVHGDVGVAGRTVEVDAGFADIVEAADSILAFSGRLEVGYGPVAGFIDGYYADLGADDVTNPLGLDVDATFKQGIIDFGGMYRLVDREPVSAAPGSRHLTLDAYAGGRYSSLELELDVATVGSRSRRETWVDPIVGAKLVLPVAERWHLSVNGDIGGFGVESNLTWSATGVIGYGFELLGAAATLYAGYRAIGWDFDTGSGLSEFVWDVTEHGPLLGFGVRF
jgi:hypothetical protein